MDIKRTTISNFFKAQLVTSVYDRLLNDVCEEKVDSVLSKIENIKLNGFPKRFKEDQIKLVANLIEELGLPSAAHQYLAGYCMVNSASDNK